MSLYNNKALDWHLIEAGTGLGEMTQPLACSFISKPKTSGEALHILTHADAHARELYFFSFPLWHFSYENNLLMFYCVIPDEYIKEFLEVISLK